MSVHIPTADRGTIRVSEDTFILFVDETGEDSLSDPNFPIFGFGGVGLPAKLYGSNICNPWIHIKEQAFGGEATPMHAADLRRPTSEQLELLNKFFSTCAFTRIAAIVSDKTAFTGEFDLYHIAVVAFYQRIAQVLSHTHCTDVFLIFEDSERGNRLNHKFFEQYHIERSSPNGTAERVPMTKAIMSKTEREPGLEVADFVAHTAGASVRARLLGKRTKDNERKDFSAIFNFKDPRLVSFLEITKVEDRDAEQ